MPKTIKVQVSKTCAECGTIFSGRRQSRVCSKVCAFWALFDKSAGPNACWPYMGHTSPQTGYGDVPDRLGIDGKRATAHRQAWRLHNCCDPDKLYILHRCDNRRCGNPAHLRLGSQKANVIDGQSKGRITHLSPGEKNPQSILTDAAVREIRSGGASTSALAARYGVTASAIRSARRGASWRHLS